MVQQAQFTLLNFHVLELCDYYMTSLSYFRCSTSTLLHYLRTADERYINGDKYAAMIEFELVQFGL